MGLKKYYASDMSEAMAKIRADLGASAVILDTQKLERGLEVIAMSESQLTGSPPSAIAPKRRQIGEGQPSDVGESGVRNQKVQSEGLQVSLTAGASPEVSNSERSSNSKLRKDLPSAAAIYSAGITRESEEIHSELGNIRSMLQQWIGSTAWTDYSAQSPNQARLWEKFSAMGIDARIIQSLIGEVDPVEPLASAWGMCLARLAQRVPIAKESLENDGGIYAFVGATGVGKTSTIGKLAARHVLSKGTESIALISTDNYRLAAQEQLNTLGKILGIGVYSVADEKELDATLSLLSEKELVLVDTAGLSRGDKSESGNQSSNASQVSLRTLGNSRYDIKPVMVLSATSQRHVTLSELDACSALPLHSVVISKTDEAVSLGEVLSAVIERGLEVAFESCGQDIPADIHVAKRHQLISKAVAVATGKEIDHCDFLATFSQGQNLGLLGSEQHSEARGTFA